MPVRLPAMKELVGFELGQSIFVRHFIGKAGLRVYAVLLFVTRTIHVPVRQSFLTC